MIDDINRNGNDKMHTFLEMILKVCDEEHKDPQAETRDTDSARKTVGKQCWAQHRLDPIDEMLLSPEALTAILQHLEVNNQISLVNR